MGTLCPGEGKKRNKIYNMGEKEHFKRMRSTPAAVMQSAQVCPFQIHLHYRNRLHCTQAGSQLTTCVVKLHFIISVWKLTGHGYYQSSGRQRSTVPELKFFTQLHWWSLNLIFIYLFTYLGATARNKRMRGRKGGKVREEQCLGQQMHLFWCKCRMQSPDLTSGNLTEDIFILLSLLIVQEDNTFHHFMLHGSLLQPQPWQLLVCGARTPQHLYPCVSLGNSCEC